MSRNFSRENNTDDVDYDGINQKDGSSMIFVDGNDADFEERNNKEILMERVWWLCKPPAIPNQTLIVPARRVQIIEERLNGTIKPRTIVAVKSDQGRTRDKV